jgi:hypothetical protein
MLSQLRPYSLTPLIQNTSINLITASLKREGFISKGTQMPKKNPYGGLSLEAPR